MARCLDCENRLDTIVDAVKHALDTDDDHLAGVIIILATVSKSNNELGFSLESTCHPDLDKSKFIKGAYRLLESCPEE